MKKGFTVFRQGLRLRKGVTPVLAALLLLVLVFALFTTVGAQIDPQAKSALDLSVVRDCPDGIEQRLPSRVVLQYIDGVFHKWEEYDLDAKGALLHLPEKTGTAPAVRRRGQDAAGELRPLARAGAPAGNFANPGTRRSPIAGKARRTEETRSLPDRQRPRLTGTGQTGPAGLSGKGTSFQCPAGAALPAKALKMWSEPTIGSA